MSEKDGRFSMVQRVRFGDLDAMQHLNNVEYLRFFETARIEYMRTLIPGRTPASPETNRFIFTECHIAYRSPALYDEDIRTFVWPSELKRSSIKLQFEMRSDSDDRLLAEGYGVLVGYDYVKGKVELIPDAVRARVDIVPARA